MENKFILQQLRLYVALLELHQENDFKVRSYQNAIFQIEKQTTPLAAMSLVEISSLKGIGKSIAQKIQDIIQKQTFEDLDLLLRQTPAGVIAMLKVQGLGKKKIWALWKEHHITNLDQLYKACENGEVAQWKGFGEKMQENIKNALLYQRSTSNKLFWAEAQPLALSLQQYVAQIPQCVRAEIAGEVRRGLEVVETLQVLVATHNISTMHQALDACPLLCKNAQSTGVFAWRGTWQNTPYKVAVHFTKPELFANQWLKHSASWEHLQHSVQHTNLAQTIAQKPFPSEEAVYQQLNIPYILPLHREGNLAFKWIAQKKYPPKILQIKDLKGVLHAHSTYSDGEHTLAEMRQACMQLGYEYLGITDHSQAAFYANGLDEKRIEAQHREIDQLNAQNPNFTIFKGIEADILADGSLDYSPAILQSFDFVIASVHSGLQMNIEKATNRLIRAIENPHTHILGHPTGRILLRRQGYPVDMLKVIEACAANGVAIEINASPYRLDLDWRWIDIALNKGVTLCINPDAHSQDKIQDIQYGVIMAQKGGLPPEMTLNCLHTQEIARFFLKKKQSKK